MRPVFIPPEATLAMIEAEMFSIFKKPETPAYDPANVELLLRDAREERQSMAPPIPARPTGPVKHIDVANSTVQGEIMRLTEHSKKLEARIARDTTELSEVRATVAAYMSAAKVLASGVPKQVATPAPSDQPTRPSVATEHRPPAPVR